MRQNSNSSLSRWPARFSKTFSGQLVFMAKKLRDQSMKHRYSQTRILISGLAAIVATATPFALAAPPAGIFNWVTVVNKEYVMPNSTSGRTFNSFNQPSVNANGLVVFRARSRGGLPEGSPTHGIYTRAMSMGTEQSNLIKMIAGGDTTVPYPNNIEYPPDNLLTTFIEFPSIPRVAVRSNAVATRGNHQPVWAYSLDSGDEARTGTSGIYVNLNSLDPMASELVSGATKLGAVPEFETIFQVPGAAPGTPFDVFPGAPAITDSNIIAFKGNYSVPAPTVEDPDATVGKTGVYYRTVKTSDAGGNDSIHLIANSDTVIPNLPQDAPPGTKFGSTAPPSAAGNNSVFVGLDIEAAPNYGGIYLAPLAPSPQLTTLVGLGSPVPNAGNAKFTQLGEGLSYDGRFVGFWGAWGNETKTIRLYCPEEGNKDRIDFCNQKLKVPDPDQTGEFLVKKDENSICDDSTDDTENCYQEKEIPVKQGIFIHDTKTGKTQMVARTGDVYDDFVYWVYSGKVPGTGEGHSAESEEDDGEPARWRSSAFIAVSSSGSFSRTAFKARMGELDSNNAYLNPIDGIYLGKKPGNSPIMTVLDTTMPGTVLDTCAVNVEENLCNNPDADPLPITELGIERDSFRGNWLVVSAKMGTEEEGWAGIYRTKAGD